MIDSNLKYAWLQSPYKDLIQNGLLNVNTVQLWEPVYSCQQCKLRVDIGIQRVKYILIFFLFILLLWFIYF